MVRNLSDFVEKGPVFIDANIFLCHAFGTSDDASDFLQKAESSSLRASTSSLVLEEVFFKLLMQSASNFIEKVTVEKVKSLLKKDVEREAILGPLVEYRKYIKVLEDFGMRVFDVTGADVFAATDLSGIHNLLIADATHLAVMKRKKIEHLASGDWDFAAVSDITVWSPSSGRTPHPAL